MKMCTRACPILNGSLIELKQKSGSITAPISAGGSHHTSGNYLSVSSINVLMLEAITSFTNSKPHSHEVESLIEAESED
jgi:hypothetical protein